MRTIEQYFRRFGCAGPQIDAPPPANLAMVVVVPCFDEPDLVGSLESLWQCERPQGAVEVIVVVNSAETSPPELKDRNVRTVAAAREWERNASREGFHLRLLQFPDLPRKRAGVGLARKLGMDEGLRRLQAAGRWPEGVLLCYDADCRCDPDLLARVETHFRRNRSTPGCSIYFEHPLKGEMAPSVYKAIAAYELHLRYYVGALRFAGFPHAFHTVGSAMAVRAGVYAAQGGMNKRQAGEDFYFLHKIIPLGGFTDLTSTRVIPSPRPSHRVPFGTGRAVGRALESEEPLKSYPWEAFVELRGFLRRLPAIFERPDWDEGLSETVRAFLDGQRFENAVEEIRGNTHGWSGFERRFYRWFDGFRVMKFVHHARDSRYGERGVEGEAAKLLEALGEERRGSPNLFSMLDRYRARDRQSAWTGQE